jgi:hypothetical protein
MKSEKKPSKEQQTELPLQQEWAKSVGNDKIYYNE